MYLSQRTQITHLKIDKVPIKILNKYADFADVFLPMLAIEFSKHTSINNHAIELVNNW